MPTKLQPLGNRVIIEETESADKIGSLYVPEHAKDRPFKGKIVAKGPDCDTLVKGDLVIYGKYSGHEIEHDGKMLLVIKESDVLVRIS